MDKFLWNLGVTTIVPQMYQGVVVSNEAVMEHEY
jgi:hypothetical protein